jgi:regulatory protein
MTWARAAKPLDARQRTDPAAARAAAVALLARRDFPSAELRKRLCARGFGPDAVAEVIAGLVRERILDDARFAHNYVGYRAPRGQGPRRIAAELLKHGLAEELVDAALAHGPDWNVLAAEVRRVKFGAAAPANVREWDRQARFLQYRGFSADHIRAATGADPDTD